MKHLPAYIVVTVMAVAAALVVHEDDKDGPWPAPSPSAVASIGPRPALSTSASMPPVEDTAHRNDPYWGVHQRAFCAPEGARGRSDDGRPMYCLREGIDTKPRWSPL